MLGNADPVILYFDADGNMVDVLATASYMCENGECFYANMDVLVPVNVPAGWGAGTAAAPAMADIITTDALTATGAVGAALSALGEVGGYTLLAAKRGMWTRTTNSTIPMKHSCQTPAQP